MDLLLSLTVKNMLRYSLSILAQYKLKNGSMKRNNSVASCEKILFRRLEYESDEAKSYRPDGHLLKKSFMKLVSSWIYIATASLFQRLDFLSIIPTHVNRN